MPAPLVCNIFPDDQRFRRCQSHRNSDFLELWLKRRFVKLIEPSRDTCNLIHSKISIYLKLHKVLYIFQPGTFQSDQRKRQHTLAHTTPACSLNKIRYCFFFISFKHKQQFSAHKIRENFRKKKSIKIHVYSATATTTTKMALMSE